MMQTKYIDIYIYKHDKQDTSVHYICTYQNLAKYLLSKQNITMYMYVYIMGREFLHAMWGGLLHAKLETFV